MKLTAVTVAVAIFASPAAVLTPFVIGKALEFVVVPRLKFMAVLVLRLYVNLFVAKLAERSVSHSRVKPAFKVLCEGPCGLRNRRLASYRSIVGRAASAR